MCEIIGSGVGVPVKHTVSAQLEESMRVYNLWNPCECAAQEMLLTVVMHIHIVECVIDTVNSQ